MLSMLAWVPTGKVEIGHNLFVRQEDTTFIDLLIAYHLILNRCIERSGTVQMMNPRILAEDHFDKIRFQRVVARLEKNIQEEIGTLWNHVL